MNVKSPLLLILLLFGIGLYAQQDKELLKNKEKNLLNLEVKQRDFQTQQILRQAKHWKQFEEKFGAWYVDFDERTGMPQRAFGTPIATAYGNQAELIARNFLQNELSMFGIAAQDFKLSSSPSTDKYTFVNFEQYFKNVVVLHSAYTIRLTKDNRIPSFGISFFNIPQNFSVKAVLSENTATQFATQDLEGVLNTNVSSLAILPIPVTSGYEYKLVYPIEVKGKTEELSYDFLCYIDANNGEILYRNNRVCYLHQHQEKANTIINATANVKGNPNLPAVENLSLPYVRIRVNGVDYYADENGMFPDIPINTPTTATVYLEGKRVKVIQYTDGGNNTVAVSNTLTLNPGDTNIDFTNLFTDRQLAVYYHTCVVYDHFTSTTNGGVTPILETGGFPIWGLVDVPGACNAFYDGSINFFPPGGPCPATSLFDDVIYHEFGHHINNHFPGQDMTNGAPNEGYADVWAFSITENPVLGPGFSGTGSFVRRYDVNPKVYPQDVVGQVHSDGEIIAGAWWDTYLNLGQDMPTMLQLFRDSQAGYADQGLDLGTLYRNILIETLFADDDNANLSDGTPNMNAILDGFAKHGITLFAGSIIFHLPEEHYPADTDLRIDATVVLNDALFTAFVSDVTIYYQVNNGAWQTATMSGGIPNGEAFGDFSFTIPGVIGGSIIKYGMTLTDAFQTDAVAYPIGINIDQIEASNAPLVTLVGYDNIIRTDDFDNTSIAGWEVNVEGTDNAILGNWELAAPIVDSYTPPQSSISVDITPNSDHTITGNPTNLCWITGKDLGENVNRGVTTLYSPIINMSNLKKPAVSYWRWFTNDIAPNGRSDAWQVYVTNDLVNWVLMENTVYPDREWRKIAYRVKDFVSLSSTVRFKFVAQDPFNPAQPLQGASLVEALLDDFMIYDSEITSTDDLKTNVSLDLFPNPATQQFSIEWEGNRNKEDITLKLYNQLGQLVIAKEYNAGGSIIVDVASLENGIYFVEIEGEEIKAYSKLTIQK